MCGLVGVVSDNDIGVCLYDTLTVLQHRGQDAAGIMTCDNGKLNLRKDNGHWFMAIVKRPTEVDVTT